MQIGIIERISNNKSYRSNIQSRIAIFFLNIQNSSKIFNKKHTNKQEQMSVKANTRSASNNLRRTPANSWPYSHHGYWTTISDPFDGRRCWWCDRTPHRSGAALGPWRSLGCGGCRTTRTWRISVASPPFPGTWWTRTSCPPCRRDCTCWSPAGIARTSRPLFGLRPWSFARDLASF